jgi:exonuclease III
MRQFCSFLNDAVLKEIHLNGMLYTWSNEHAHPMLERIDWAFVSNGWECIFLRCNLHALPSHCSDHAPLRLDVEATEKQKFLFQPFWTK